MGDRHYFMVDPAAVQDNKFKLDKSESHHLVHVLRIKPGAEIWLINGFGSTFRAVFTKEEGGLVSGIVDAEFPGDGELPVDIQLAIGLIKREKLELVAEKATELGAKSIAPLVLNRSIRRSARVDRLEKIVLTATKQCGRGFLPECHEPLKLKAWLEQSSNHQKLVCHQLGEKTLSEAISSSSTDNNRLAVLIGPEGDFSDEELELLKENGAEFVTLGNRRLRSETAAISAMAVLNESFHERKQS